LVPRGPKPDDIATRRLFTQRLAGPPFASAADAVHGLGAIQSQDYSGAKWALGQRVQGLRDKDMDRLYDEGAILRTHVLRPTWHFVLPRDIRWLLELSAPRVKAAMAYYSRQHGLDAALLRRAYRALERALRDSTYRSRAELSAILSRAHIPGSGERLYGILMHAELDALVTSGPRRGKQMTYALLDERAPTTPRRTREEALEELARRYFSGHGPAQVRDFAWWSGLSVAEANRGLALTERVLVREEFGGRTYWSLPSGPVAKRRSSSLHLLPNFDEFLVAYKDRSASCDPARGFDTARFGDGGILSHMVIWRGQIWGRWKLRLEGGRLRVSLVAMGALDRAARASLARAANALARFLETPVDLDDPTDG
jgi:hypothetical protein